MFLLPHSVGGYTLHRKLGTGGVAESYLGTHDAGSGRQLVIRRILPFILRDAARLAAIEARIRDLIGAPNPFLVHVMDHVVAGDEHFIVEEFVHGTNLEQVLNWCRQTGHTIPQHIFLNIATQICNGLGALHSRPAMGSSGAQVLHLSLRPAAVFLSPEGKVLLGGFGLSRSPTTHPQGGVAGPIPARMEYLSPEQTQPDQKLDPSSDIFALGSLLYELLGLGSLFRAESNLQTIHRVRRAEVTAQLLQAKERMPGLDKVLFRSLALDPKHRYQRTFVLREDLRGLMAGYSFATIGEDTRAFLQPLLSGVGAAPAPFDADPFSDAQDTSIDADPLASAAMAAAALSQRVAKERGAESAPEHTERTDAHIDAELTPLPNFVFNPPVVTAAPTWVPDVRPDVLPPYSFTPDNSGEPSANAYDPPPKRTKKAPARSFTLAPPERALPAMAAPPALPPPVAVTLAAATRSFEPLAVAPPPPIPEWGPFREEDPPSRGPLFASVAIGTLAAVLLCAGIAYWDASTPPAPEPPIAAVSPKGEAAPADNPADLFAALAPVPAEEVATPEPPPKPAPVAKVSPPPAPKPAPVAKVSPPPAPKRAAKGRPQVAKLVATPTVTEPPTGGSLDIYAGDARGGRLSSVDVSLLEGVAATDPQFTRSRALLMMNAQKKGDEVAAHRYLDQAMTLPENGYNPALLAEAARWHVNRGEYERALQKAGEAERNWARLPSDLVFAKKAEIYEVEAAAWQGKFYKSGEDLELLYSAVRGWERYRSHVATLDKGELTKKADIEIAKLNDIRTRLE
ncbi:MAG: serine/threonine protein kinase [Myxococcales bacterium]|nr:serine/threonine protein kinase [Myxococcales bacterium]